MLSKFFLTVCFCILFICALILFKYSNCRVYFFRQVVKKKKNKKNQNFKSSDKQGINAASSQHTIASQHMNSPGPSGMSPYHHVNMPGPSNHGQYHYPMPPPLNMPGHFQQPCAPLLPTPVLSGPPLNYIPPLMANPSSPSAPPISLSRDMPNNRYQNPPRPYQPNIVNAPNNFGYQKKEQPMNKPSDKAMKNDVDNENMKKRYI